MNPNLIIFNAKVYTVNPDQPWAEAVACENGRILAVGSTEEIDGLATANTKRIDADGRLLLPGFTDAHVHFLGHAKRRQELNLYGVADFEEAMAMVKTAVAKLKPGQWLRGGGWDENLWGVQPHKQQLDAIAPQNPVALTRMDSHTMWVNSAALRFAQIDTATPDPPESRIERDADGSPNGLLREWNAIALVRNLIPKPDDATLLRWLEEAIADAHALGLTGVHDQRVEKEGARSLRLLSRLNQDGRLLLRTHANIAADYLPQALTLGLQPGFGDERLWLGQVKSFADGAMGSNTSLMLEPLEDDPANTGIAVTSREELWAMARQANDAGFAISVHAIGDRAVRNVLDVICELPANGALTMPHRIEHVQLIHPNDLPRLAQHNIIASMQPVHLMPDWKVADRVWGERARYTYAFRSLLDSGAILAFGSDAPVAPINPMFSVYAALTRMDAHEQPQGGWYPQEKITLEEVIYAFTMGPAIMAGKQGVQGSIAPGKWADMILMEEDLFAMAAEDMRETAVRMTVFAGDVVYNGG